MAMMMRRVLPTLVVLTALAACSDGAKPTAQPRTTTAAPADVAAPAATTTTTSATHRFNPTHDPTKCVRLLRSGQVVFVEILLVPGKPKPAYVNGAKCG